MFSMPFLAYSKIFLLWMLLLFSSSAMTQLTFDSSCYNVVINKGTSKQSTIDGSVRIENAFDIVRNVTAYANRMLTAAIWNPNFAKGNKQRVLDLLVAFCLPQDHPRFRNMANALIGTLYGIINPVQVLISVTSSIS